MTSEYRISENVQLGLTIATGGPITQKFLNSVMHNDSLLWEKKVDASVRNVHASLDSNGRNNPRRQSHRHYLEHDLAIWADVKFYTFGPHTTIGPGDTRPSWTGFRYDFPTNGQGDFFHDDYLPTVVCQIYNNNEVAYPNMTLVMLRVATNWFKFEIHQLETGSFVTAGEHFWISVLAIGRKGDFFPKVTTKLKTPNSFIPISSLSAGTVL